MIGSSKSLSGFDPRTIPGCQLWLDPANSSSLTLSGANVVTIADSSTTGVTATRLAGNSYATTTTISGNRILSFSSENIVYRSPMVLTGAAYTIFVIGSLLSGSGYQRIVNTDGSGGRIFIGANNGSFVTFTGNNNFNDVAVNTPGYTLTGAGLQLMSIVVSGSSLIPYINGTAMNTKTGTTGATTVLDIGAYEDGVTQAWKGYIGDIIVYNSALTTAQRQQVEGYLAHKWGLVPYYDSSIPLTIPGCQLWLDSADTSSFTLSGSNVTQWSDKSGNGNNATPHSTSPQRVGNSVLFSGSNALKCGKFLTSTSYSVFIVNTFPSGSDNNISFGCWKVQSGSSANIQGGAIRVGVNNSQSYSVNIVNSTASSTVNRVYGLTVSSSSTPGSAFTLNGSIDGSNVSLSGTSASGNATICEQDVTIGGLMESGTPQFQLNGYVYEVVVFNSALTTSERQTIERYLMKKWAIGTNPTIPSTHPFSSVRPHLRAFQPTDIDGCQLWLDAADASTVTLSTSKVTQWNDKSGNGYNFTQSTSGNQPTYSTSSLNNLNTITFTASNSTYLLGTASTNFIGTNSLSMYGIFKTNDANSGSSVFAKSLYGGAAGRILYGYRDPGTPGFIVFANSDGIAHDIPDTYTPGAWRIAGFVSDRSGWTNITYQNGVVTATKTSGADTTTNLTNAFPMLVGAYNNSSGGANPPQADRYLDGAVGELIIFNNALTTSQRQQVEGYLAHKWGLTLYLPVISPLSIAGCQMWLDGADPAGNGVIPSNGATVSTWVDKSGNGYNATAAPSRTAGTYSTSFRAVNFPTSTTGYITNYSASPTNETMFVVFNNPTSSFYNNILIGGVQGARSLGAAYNGNVVSSNVVGNLNTQVAWLAHVGTYTLGTTALVTSQFTTSTNSISLNGGTAGTGGAPGFTSGRVTYLGVDATNGSFYYVGYAMEIIFYNSILSTEQRQQVEGYLARKWGITISATLPSLHPFKSIPPASLPFSPRNISGCLLWLDAADELSFTGPIWNDKSGTNNHAVNGTPGTSSMPTVTTWSNGRRAARFVRTSKNSIKTTNSIPIYVTYFIVARIQDVTGPTGIGFIMINNVDGQRQVRTNSTSFPVSVFFFTQTGGTNMVFGSFSQGQGFLFSGTVTSGSAIAYGNGVQSGTSGVNNSSPSRHYFGSGDGDNDYLSVDFAEILIYDSILTTIQRQQVEGYLAHKWGLTPTYATNTPLTIPGCTLWLDGADPLGNGVIPSDGTSISPWYDKSVSGYNAIIVNNPAVLKRNIQNSNSVMRFNSTRYSVTYPSFPSTGYTFFVVMYLSTNSGSYQRIINGSFSDQYLFIGTNSGSIATFNGNGTWNDINANWPPITNFQTWRIVTVTVGSSVLTPYVDGTRQDTKTGTTAAFSNLYIGDSGQHYFGDIGEILVYNSVLTTSQRQTIEGYLAKKWGLTVSGQFPSTHPYSKFPPA